MENYVTLFDRNFLPQGLALLDSLERYAGDYVLWVLCLDSCTQQVLDELANPNVRTIPLTEVETPELLAVKPKRTRAEYAWTLTPFTPRFVFQRDACTTRVTYLDADLFMLKSPKPIFEEFEASGKSVLITEHEFDAEYDRSAASGRFCVQFMTFVRDASEPVRLWWAERCLEWCFARSEDQKFGDQKYLDDWPERFPDHVHILRKEDAILAPWNARRFPYSKAIVWHFHGLRINDNTIQWYVGYTVPRVVEKMVYEPYVALLEEKIRTLGMSFKQGQESWLLSIIRKARNLDKVTKLFRRKKITRISK